MVDITKMLAELREERERIEQAILVLERIASGRSRIGAVVRAQNPVEGTSKI